MLIVASKCMHYTYRAVYYGSTAVMPTPNVVAVKAVFPHKGATMDPAKIIELGILLSELGTQAAKLRNVILEKRAKDANEVLQELLRLMTQAQELYIAAMDDHAEALDRTTVATDKLANALNRLNKSLQQQQSPSDSEADAALLRLKRQIAELGKYERAMEFELERLNQQTKTLQQHALTIEKVVNDITTLTAMVTRM